MNTITCNEHHNMYIYTIKQWVYAVISDSFKSSTAQSSQSHLDHH